MKLSQQEFEAVQDKIDAAVRATKRGTPDRADAEAKSQAWEAAIALPQQTFAEREARFSAIAKAAEVWS